MCIRDSHAKNLRWRKGENLQTASEDIFVMLKINHKDASKPVSSPFNLPNHSTQNTNCGLSLHEGSTESSTKLEQKVIFQRGTLNPQGINERVSFNYHIHMFTWPLFHQWHSYSSPDINTHDPQSLYSLLRRANAWNVSFVISENLIFMTLFDTIF